MAPCLLSHSTTQRLLTLSLTMGVFLLVGSWLVVAGGFGEVFAWESRGGGGGGWGWGFGRGNGSGSGSVNWHDDVGVLEFVNPKIGTYGVTPNGNGGMVPSVGMPFGMTRWTAQTREVSSSVFSPVPLSKRGRVLIMWCVLRISSPKHLTTTSTRPSTASKRRTSRRSGWGRADRW